MKSVFKLADSQELIARINKLNPETKQLWGKMNVAQMLAHCNVTYELVYEDKHPKPNAVAKFFIKLFAKETVVGDKPYSKNGRTAPVFIITDERVFQAEKERLINHIKKTQEMGESFFDGKESHGFGVLTIKQWNNLFYKHLDHHLSQFGV
jgi:hypothetical protein